MCVLCASFIQTNRLLPLQDYMHGIPQAIFFVDRDAVVLGGNRAAEQVVGRPSSQFEGQRGGDVIACAFADLPGGCGNTRYCSSCPIRNTVTQTFTTGRGLDRVEARRPIVAESALDELRLVLTTRLVEGVVLLRIDEMERQPGRVSRTAVRPK